MMARGGGCEVYTAAEANNESPLVRTSTISKISISYDARTCTVIVRTASAVEECGASFIGATTLGIGAARKQA